ncbi:MAG: polysaccharide deacetylase family protein [Flavobacteriales bacterium]
MIVFTSNPTARFKYACEQVFRDLEGDWRITSDLDAFKKYDGPKISYGLLIENSTDVCYVESTSGIWENQIQIDKPVVSRVNSSVVLFANNSDIGFDLFAAGFFMLARWEEYLPFESDDMHRFNAGNSIFAKEKAYHKPWVDIWIREFENHLKNKWPELRFHARKYRFISTMDIDSAYAYRHKGAYRSLGGMAQDLARFDFGNLVKRFDALLGGKDSYDTYEYIEKKLRRHKCEHIYFFLLADFGPHDKNLPHTSEGLCKLIRRMAVHYKVGIHPGVGSHQHISVLRKEIGRLKFILQNEVRNSRQHYLKFHFPETYSRLIECEILDEYSMGFADDIGFRAGTSRSFYWFDLEKNLTTALCVHPFAVMETSLNKYLRLSAEEAIQMIHTINDEVRDVQGEFIALWHNETLSETKEWKGWRKVWEALLEKAF